MSSVMFFLRYFNAVVLPFDATAMPAEHFAPPRGPAEPRACAWQIASEGLQKVVPHRIQRRWDAATAKPEDGLRERHLSSQMGNSLIKRLLPVPNPFPVLKAGIGYGSAVWVEGWGLHLQRSRWTDHSIEAIISSRLAIN